MNEWIKVEERLPKEPGRYWVTYSQTDLSLPWADLGYWGGDQWVNVYPVFFELEISHWMHLPEPPNTRK